MVNLLNQIPLDEGIQQFFVILIFLGVPLYLIHRLDARMKKTLDRLNKEL